MLSFVYFRALPKRVEIAKENREERAKLTEASSLSEPDKEVIRREMRCKKYTLAHKNENIAHVFEIRIYTVREPYLIIRTIIIACRSGVAKPLSQNE